MTTCGWSRAPCARCTGRSSSWAADSWARRPKACRTSTTGAPSSSSRSSPGSAAERLRIGAPGTERWTLHNAANLVHIAADSGLTADEWLAYRVAWVPGCVLYRRDALLEVGGFDFWRDLPPEHGGEDVAAEWRVMERFGGAGLLPSGAVHLETPTSIPDRTVDAPAVVFAGGR